MIFDDNSVPFSKLSLVDKLFICPCKKPAANKSPAPVKSIIFRFFLFSGRTSSFSCPFASSKGSWSTNMEPC